MTCIRVLSLSLSLLLSGTAHAQEAGVTALLDHPLLKALGVKDPLPESGVYKAKMKLRDAAEVDFWIHNKTSDASWVGMVALPPSPNALQALSKQVTLTFPVLVIATTAASANVSTLPPALKASLAPVAVNGVASWEVGANLLSKADAKTPAAQKLRDPRLGLLPTGGLLLTGTLGAAIIEQLGAATIAAPSADWSMKLTMRTTGEWKPNNSPIAAKGVSFGLTRTASAGSMGDLTFDARLDGLILNWPGYTAPANAWAAVSWTTSPSGDFSLTASFNNVFPQFTVSPLNLKKLGFFYSVTGIDKDLGLSVQIETKLPGGTPTQLFSGQARFDTAQGALTFAVKLESNWDRPFNLTGTALLRDSGLDFTVATVEPSLGFGMAANLKLDGQTYLTTLCFDVTGTGLKAVGLSFDASKLSVPTQMELMSGLINSIAPSNQTAAFNTWKADLDKLPLPEFTPGKVVVYTPGLTCPQPVFAGKPGVGATLDGNMSFLGNQLGSAKNSFAINGDANDGLFLENKLSAFSFPNSALSLGNANFKVVAPLSLNAAPNSSVAITGSASGGVLNGLSLNVKLSAQKALFDVNASLQGLGSVKLNAESSGASLSQMNDFTLLASLETDPNLKASVTNALKPVLTSGAAARKSAVSAGYQKIKKAQGDFDTIDKQVGPTLRTLTDAAARFVDGLGRCLSKDLNACLRAQDALADFKATENYAKWVAARTQLEWAKSTYATEKATFELWDNIEKEVNRAASAFTVSGARLQGSLKQGKLTLSLDAIILGKSVKGTFTVNFGTGGALGSPAETTTFAGVVERSTSDNAPKPAVLWGTGPLTSTTLKTELKDGRVVATAKVFFDAQNMITCGGTADPTKARPTGQVSLYLRRPGQPPIDRTKAIAIANANLNEKGGCQTDVVKFNAQEASCSDGSGCCDGRPQGYNLDRERGTFFLSAGYNGGPGPCAADNNPMSGYRFSLSDEVMVVVGRPDDTGELAPGEVKWGTWRTEATCPAGTWARNFGQRVEPKNPKGDDDTALNAVSLVCARPDGSSPSTIKSHDGWWGDWKDAPGCSGGSFINAVRIRLEQPQGGKKDDTAANDANFRCSNGTELSAGNGTLWGDWSEYKECPAGSAVCGLSIKLEEKKGKDGDDTAMNGLKVRCCAVQ